MGIWHDSYDKADEKAKEAEAKKKLEEQTEAAAKQAAEEVKKENDTPKVSLI